MIIIETSVFTKLLEAYLTEEEYRALQEYLVCYPDAGDLIKASGGLRKIRWQQQGKGKRRGVRVIYYWTDALGQILMLYIYPKSARSDLSASQLKQLRKIIDEEYL